MTRPKPNPQFNRAKYDAARQAPRSGSHKKPSMVLRAPQDELDAATDAAERFGVTRNDLARAALRLLSRRGPADLLRVVERGLLEELEEIGALKTK